MFAERLHMIHCLTYRSVMFTPSFILIPAREIIPGKEIGLIAAWFLISQVLAFVIPVLLNWSIEWLVQRPWRPAPKSLEMRRSSSAPPTLAGLEYEKGLSFSGDRRLSAIATGLSGVTATVIAPVSHLPMEIDDDTRRQIESIAMEFARQQGDPAVTCSPRRAEKKHHHLHYDKFSPKSDVSNFQHHHHHHQHLRGPPGMSRSVSAGRRRPDPARARSTSPSRARPRMPARATLAPATVNWGHFSVDSPFAQKSVDEVEYMSQTAPDPVRGRSEIRKSINDSGNPAHAGNSLMSANEQGNSPPSGPFETSETTMAGHSKPADSELGPTDELPYEPAAAMTRQSTITIVDGNTPPQSTRVAGRGSISKSNSLSGKPLEIISPRPSSSSENRRQRKRSDAESEPVDEEDSDDESDEEVDAVARLSSWISDLITPTIYSIVFIVGIPLYFVYDFGLLLFLALNILTFIAAITVVPPKIRRIVHPILSTSLATVLLIWAFAAMKGISLNDCLNRFYSVDAKYAVLWDPNGYEGPIPGAGDVLFSTLDAGIIALAVPMYRYRKELRETFVRMCLVLLPCVALSLFFWNLIADLMGMDAVRSLAFSARFMSTPLAIELANNIGADVSITVILVVITGVVAAILKEQFFFRLMRVRKDDYLTVGLTMGATSGAIGANSLISTPRTMAIASLSFVVFGTMLLIATAIPPIVDVVRAVSGA